MGSNEGPIHSSLDDDPAHADAIDVFVLSLADRIDELQDLERHGDLRGVAEKAADLAEGALAVGFPVLARGANQVVTAAHEKNAELAYKSLVDLTALAQRVRRGHRGAL